MVWTAAPAPTQSSPRCASFCFLKISRSHTNNLNSNDWHSQMSPHKHSTTNSQCRLWQQPPHRVFMQVFSKLAKKPWSELQKHLFLLSSQSPNTHTHTHTVWQWLCSRAGNTSHGAGCQDKQENEPGPISLATIHCIWPWNQPAQCSHPP